MPYTSPEQSVCVHLISTSEIVTGEWLNDALKTSPALRVHELGLQSLFRTYSDFHVPDHDFTCVFLGANKWWHNVSWNDSFALHLFAGLCACLEIELDHADSSMRPSTKVPRATAKTRLARDICCPPGKFLKNCAAQHRGRCSSCGPDTTWSLTPSARNSLQRKLAGKDGVYCC
jgi:hypothetical protein